MNCQLINWRPITGYEGLYEVSDTGLVRSVPRPCTKGGILKLKTHRDGYLCVGLYKNNKRKWFQVHRLVATAFIANPENKPTIEHWDENKTNNHVSNLCWATQSEQLQTRPCKGYYWHKEKGKWQVQIKIPGGKPKYLAMFDNEEDAHAAHIAAKYKYHPFWVKKQEHLEKQKKQKEQKKEILNVKITTIKK